MLAHKRTPVLVAVNDEAAGRWAVEHGANEFLLKPLDMDDLLKAAWRLTGRKRGIHDARTMPVSAGLLVVSDSLSQLISIGSSLQKQGGYKVSLGYGHKDAVEQAILRKPGAVLLDLPLADGGLAILCGHLAGQEPAPLVMAIAPPEAHQSVASIVRPRIVETIPKPFPLLSLHTKVRHATGLSPEVSAAEAAGHLRDEILRVMRANAARETSTPPKPAPPSHSPATGKTTLHLFQ